MTIALGAMAGAGAISSIVGQNSARQLAKGEENQRKNAQDDLIIENRKRATHDYLRQVRLEQLSQSQEEQSLAEQGGDILKQTNAAKGQAMASAAERGVSGNNVDMILSDYEYQQNQEVGRLRINQSQKNMQHTEAMGEDRDNYDYNVAAVKPYVPRPQAPVDYFGPIFGALGTTVSGGIGAGIGKPGGSIGSAAPNGAAGLEGLDQFTIKK